METKYYTPAEIAKLLGVSRETVYAQLHRGTLEAHRFGRSRRITESQLRACLERDHEVIYSALKPNAAI
jgi:excisionase family DNA binding protein